MNKTIIIGIITLLCVSIAIAWEEGDLFSKQEVIDLSNGQINQILNQYQTVVGSDYNDASYNVYYTTFTIEPTIYFNTTTNTTRDDLYAVTKLYLSTNIELYDIELCMLTQGGCFQKLVNSNSPRSLYDDTTEQNRTVYPSKYQKNTMLESIAIDLEVMIENLQPTYLEQFMNEGTPEI